MEAIAGQPKTAVQIPCCLCGTLIIPNNANQCGTCLAQQCDLKILNKHLVAIPPVDGPRGSSVSPVANQVQYTIP
eukprot:scaffold2719_cov266-Chaetoceros_neogracile.AAC.11